MEVPRLLVDAGLVAFSTAAIFFLRKFFIKSRELKANIKELNETVKTLRSDEESHSSERKELDTRFEHATGYLEIQRDLLIEIGKSQADSEDALKTLINKNAESQQDINEVFQKIQKDQEELNNYFIVLDNELTLKVGQVDTTLTNIFTRWEHQLEPFITTSDRDNHNLQEDFVKIKQSFQEAGRQRLPRVVSV